MLPFLSLGSPGSYSGDVAQIMQNLNVAAAQSISSRKLSGRASSSQYQQQYSRHSSEEDSLDEEYDDEDEDEELENEEEELENEESETATTPQRGDESMFGLRRRTSDLTFDKDQIMSMAFGNTDERGHVTELKTGGETSSPEFGSFKYGDVCATPEKNDANRDPDIDIDDDIDSENLISDEEDDNESGFLSQM